MRTLLHISGFLILLGATLIGATQAWVSVVGAVLLGMGIIGFVYSRDSGSPKNGPSDRHPQGAMNLA